jgi:hypothetical protein
MKSHLTCSPLTGGFFIPMRAQHAAPLHGIYPSDAGIVLHLLDLRGLACFEEEPL